MESELNLATIYTCSSHGATDLRRATLAEQFGEVGYFVEFRPAQSRGSVFWRSRHEFQMKDYVPLFDLLEKRTGRKMPALNAEGRLPGKMITHGDYGLPSEWDYYEFSAGVCRAGLRQLYNNAGSFELEIYAAEAFSVDVAKWLAAKHAEKWKWVCIEATKLRDYE
jgi:hypothetical protein